MTTSALIAEARRVGLSLRLESDNKLKWTSSSPPPPELLARLRDHKADLIAALGNIEHRGHRGHRVDEANLSLRMGSDTFGEMQIVPHVWMKNCAVNPPPKSKRSIRSPKI
jgi:hypothetical protein